MKEPLNNEQQNIDQTRRIVDRRLTELGISMPLRSTAGSPHTGGNPTTTRPGESGAAAEAHQILIAYAGGLVRASDDVVEFPMGGGKVVARMGSLPPGKLNTGAYWQVPTPWPTTETTRTGATSYKALFPCPFNIVVSKVVVAISTPQSSKHWGVKLYAADGTLILDTGNEDAGSSGNITGTVSPAVEIFNGNYQVEVYTDDSAIAFRSTSLSTNGRTFHNQENPVTLANSDFPWVKFVEA